MSFALLPPATGIRHEAVETKPRDPAVPCLTPDGKEGFVVATAVHRGSIELGG